LKEADSLRPPISCQYIEIKETQTLSESAVKIPRPSPGVGERRDEENQEEGIWMKSILPGGPPRGRHPDDNDFGAGATVAKVARQGADVRYLIATTGQRGSSDAAMTAERLSEIRMKEQMLALGYWWEYLLPNQKLSYMSR
jgi:hypothetical protein